MDCRAPLKVENFHNFFPTENLCRPITLYKLFFLRKIFQNGNGPSRENFSGKIPLADAVLRKIINWTKFNVFPSHFKSFNANFNSLLSLFISLEIDRVDSYKHGNTIPYHTIPYHTIPYHTIPYHTIPYHTIPYHTRAFDQRKGSGYEFVAIFA